MEVLQESPDYSYAFYSLARETSIHAMYYLSFLFQQPSNLGGSLAGKLPSLSPHHK